MQTLTGLVSTGAAVYHVFAPGHAGGAIGTIATIAAIAIATKKFSDYMGSSKLTGVA